MNAGKTSIRPGNGHEWEAIIVGRRLRPYRIHISLRSHIRSNRQMSDQIYVQPGPAFGALTLNGARRKAQRIVELHNRRYGFDAPIARTVEARLRTSQTQTDDPRAGQSLPVQTAMWSRPRQGGGQRAAWDTSIHLAPRYGAGTAGSFLSTPSVYPRVPPLVFIVHPFVKSI